MRLLAVTLISAAILAYEVLLARLLSIVQWYHFAYMIISMALLGFGVSGTLIALMRARLAGRGEAAFSLFAAAFGVLAIACFALAQRLPFEAALILFDPGQLLHLGAIYGLLTVPFICGATCIGLALDQFPEPVGRVYGADLLGAGLGALAILALLFLVMPARALELTGALGPIAAALVQLGRRNRAGRWWAAVSLAAALVLALALPPAWTALRPSPYKGLSQALEVPGTVVEEVRSSPLGLLSAVASPTIPFRQVPGQSLAATAEPPAQIGVFTDGEGPTPITAFDGRLEGPGHLGPTLGALPYQLLDAPEVLVLGAGGGAGVLLALAQGARQVDAVELDPGLIDLVQGRYADFAGDLYRRPDVRVHAAEARSFVAASEARYDLIQLLMLDSLVAAGTAGLYANFTYTIEAFEDYLDHLKPGGLLAIGRWLKLPPRDSLKLLTTALAALERRGVAEPARHLALLRSWDTTLLLVKKEPLDDRDLATIRGFADRWGFDLAHLPGLEAAEANRFNVLPEALFFEGAKALIGPGREAFLERYAFDLAPATDDRPYFFDFFRWWALPSMASAAARSATGLIDWGFLVLLATLVQATVLSLVLVLLPLALWARPSAATRPGSVFLYFGLIGLAFLPIEIVSIQRFTLFLGHPLYALGVVLAGFLGFAGLGSSLAPAFERALAGWRQVDALKLAIAAIGVLALIHGIVLPTVLGALIGLPEALRVGLALAVIAPLAIAMGLPFPLALARLRARAPELVPWAWGINGCASVLAAILATLLAIAWGGRAVVLLAIGLYALAALVAAPSTSTAGPASKTR